MRISSKGRYALAAMITMSERYNSGEYTTVISISEKLGISKIYLEQVFSLLKRGGIVTSTKGAQGGYRLARHPRHISVFDVLSSIELALFEPTAETVETKAPESEAALRSAVFDVLDEAVKNTLTQISLYDLVNEAEKHRSDNHLMFFI